MRKPHNSMELLIHLLQIAVLLSTAFRLCVAAADTQHKQVKKTYIVHMDKSHKPASSDDHLKWYESSLKSVSHSAQMFYTYDKVINGFSTRLTEEEAQQLEKKPGVLSILPEIQYELHTTRTPEFLGLGNSESIFPTSDKVSEVVIGVLDTGVWPESKSFDDTGLGKPPTRWKGECQVGNNFNSSSCNRKLIGARFFAEGYERAFGPVDNKTESRSPRDDEGHGTHTTTTAAGSSVSEASLFGFASGTARGMAATARVATYKVCWVGGCFGTDILAGIEQAIKDGVNVLSLSIGGSLNDYTKDTVAIGAFAAMANGIVVSLSAGNSGPSSGSLSNVAPWMITVGAGTLDRDFPVYVSLGNGQKYKGVSLYGGQPLSDEVLPIVYAQKASNSTNGNLCLPSSLVTEKVSGKIVLCDRGGNSRAQKGQVVKDAGGVGMILSNTESYGEELVADAHLLPTAAVGQKNGDLIKAYLSSEANPTATISKGATQLGVQPSPVVAAFSSRGPNPITPEILKPDLIAPGVNILAGWTGAAAPTGLDNDKRRVSFNIISGTSMSCPHVSGLVALLKAEYPEWSPAAVKSALMTTAYSMYNNGKTIIDVATGNPSTPFDYGSGHVDPVAALDPGLVYDATIDDYISFLCALNYSATEIKIVTNKDYTCDVTKKYNLGDFNYPSFAVPFQTALGSSSSVSSSARYTRTLTNVGAPATYKVKVSSYISSIKILVQPELLSFSEEYEKKTYTVTFTAPSLPSGTTSFARLEWSDGKHIVGSPIAFSWT
ncbi:subtilisin-like protease SBT1.7 [Cannabis sativa]|uniref:subtilisin-like protease SBT1.7 n=1 Tax=Cannabis sativa TaxID=3483 RepID=UPI0029C9FC1F|nr:subtilisin-like protease SBT1.7 [Cannabis sativa]